MNLYRGRSFWQLLCSTNRLIVIFMLLHRFFRVVLNIHLFLSEKDVPKKWYLYLSNYIHSLNGHILCRQILVVGGDYFDFGIDTVFECPSKVQNCEFFIWVCEIIWFCTGFEEEINYDIFLRCVLGQKFLYIIILEVSIHDTNFRFHDFSSWMLCGCNAILAL